MRSSLFIIVIIATSFGNEALATVARQAVMGGEPVFTSPADSGATTNVVNGSLWYDDDYNIFYNPSYVMDNRNYVVIQKGLEGGFFSSIGENYSYGIYFNRGGGTAETIYGGQLVAPGIVTTNRSFIGTAPQVLNTQRPVDIFIAGDTYVKWGVKATWAYNRDETIAIKTQDDAHVIANYLHVDAGAQVLGLEPFLGITFNSGYENTLNTQLATQNLEEYIGGLRYKYEAWVPYVVYHHYRETGLQLNQATQKQARMNILGGGIGHDSKVADGIHVYENAAYWTNWVQDDTQSDPTNIRNTLYTDTIVPLNVAIEGEATSWLTLRAGATYHFINQRTFGVSNTNSALDVGEKRRSGSAGIGASTPTFRVGATIKFGKLHIDSAFGTGQTTGALSSADTTNLDTSNVGFDSQTFALLSVSYHW